ncbi:MAG: FAD:protein FMN transferase [Propionibacteriaceae bacterium]|jgi:thiamine biosynthesis lipoprotein ApbE|nr:FAD:protein FMN transferase [Propionibacteriaceae bacterium]
MAAVERVESLFPAMGTLVRLTAVGADADQAVDAGAAIARDLEGRLSRFRPDSEICTGKWSSDTAELLRLADQFRSATDGAFDVGTPVDLGAIGKGYAVDAILAAWRQLDLVRGMVNFGESSIGFRGDNWKVGLKDAGRILRVAGGCLSTSSNASGHIVDRRMPPSPCSQPPLKSVTVLGASATACEAWSTAVIVDRSLLSRLPVGLSAVVTEP